MEPPPSQHSEYFLSLDKKALQRDTIHAFLTTSYWSPGISRSIVDTAIDNSLTIGAFDANKQQIGFARLVTDYATFGYLADVFVLEAYRGKGVGRRMTEALLGLREVKMLRRILLATRDAHGVYEKAGFQRISDPTPFMQIVRPTIYLE